MSQWLQQLMPDEYVASVFDIDLERLWEQGKRLLLTDLDNTLVPWNHETSPAPLLAWLERARVRGFLVCIVSNNRSQRVQTFATRTGIAAIGKARKPRPDAFRQALQQFDVRPEQAVMVGDQLFTDVRGGNRMGLHTILVLPIDPLEWWGTRLMRQIERVTLHRLRRRGLQVPERREER